MGKKIGRLDMVQKVAKHGTKASELLWTGADGHQRIWQSDEKNPSSRGRKSPSQRDKELENRWREEKDYEKGVSEVVKNFEMEGLMAEKGLWNVAKEKIMKETGELSSEEGDVVKDFKAMHEEDFWSS